MSIKIKNLSFSYNVKPVLDDISFEINEGDFLALLGPNGAGKSTLFKCILGFEKDYKGEILIDDEDSLKMSAKVLSNKIAYVPQYTNTSFDFTVLDTVIMGMTNQLSTFSKPTKEHKEKALEILKTLGIEELKDRYLSNISGGERQLAIIGRALAQNTKILVLDEPAASLDYGNQYRVLNTISKLADKNYAIIMSTHDPNQAYLYANKALAIKNGKIVTYGNTREVLSSEVLSYMYGIAVSKKVVEFENGRGVTVCIPQGSKRPSMSLWKDDMIRFMAEASIYGDYHKNLSKEISKYLEKEDTVLDAGCGLGFLSIELSKYVKKVLAVDINKNALDYLEKNNTSKNVEIINTDLKNNSSIEKCEVLVFNYFGKIEEILEIAKKYCTKRVIIITRNTDKSGFSLNDKQVRNHHFSLFEYLDENEIEYVKEEHNLEFGQPLESIDKAVEFFKMYNNENDTEVTKDKVKEKIVDLDDDKYKFYYPYTKKIVLIKIEMEDLF